MKFSTLIAACGLLLSGAIAFAQGSRADYERAANLSRLTANKVFRDRVEPHWLPGNDAFWYEVKTGAETSEFVFVDAAKGERRLAFDHARLAEALRNAGVKEAKPEALPLKALQWNTNGTVTFTAAGKRWSADLASYALSPAGPAQTETSDAFAPEDAPRRSTSSGDETSLTFINKTSADLELNWVDTEGQRRSYGKLRPGASRVQHTFAGHVWMVLDNEGKPLVAFQGAAQPSDAVIDGKRPPRRSRTAGASSSSRRNRSPDGKWEALIRKDNVVLREVETKAEQVVTTDGIATNSYSDRFYWSPDSSHFVAVRVAQVPSHKISFIESSPKDQVEPKLHTFDYFKAGDALPKPQPTLIDVRARKAQVVDDRLFKNPFTESGSLNVRWSPDSKQFTFSYNQRGHQLFRVIAVSAATGEARAIVEETSKTFIDYSGKQLLDFIDESDELVWTSERDGWNHLYLYDTKTGQVKNQMTRGEWVVRSVERVDKKARQIWFRAGGIRPGQDPYYQHLCRVNFDGSSLVVLTEGDGTHTTQVSPDNRFVIDTWSRVDLAPVTELRRCDTGALVCALERADASALEKTGWRAPERFVAKGRDGKTDIYGVIVRPSNFDSSRSYPVIEHIYAGPHGAFVPKNFRPFQAMQEMAELGFIVVQIDGMGTSYRSKAFHDVCWKNLADSGFPDRILWMKAAAAKYPQMDLSRVGIYGGSAGGQSSTRAMLDHGDFYKVAVSDCGCHDNRMDKIWWNEQWMGWPVDESYARNSNVTAANKLTGKLLLVVGEMDRNVDPASTMQVVNALVKADKDFDLLVVPGAGHGAAESPYGKRRRADYFVRHLLGKEPRWN